MSVSPEGLAPPPCLHLHPPATPAAWFARRRLLVGIVGGFAFLATAASISHAWLLLRWDQPFQRFVESRRGDEWDAFFSTASRFGSTVVVLSMGALLAALTWRRCRAVAIAILFATLARPVLEFFLKLLVARDRPDLEPLTRGVGYSFPSGHVMASVALWGMLPVVVGLFTHRRALWWASVALSAVMIGLISASRIYLGVHWLSDVVGGLLIGSLFLMGVEWVMQRAHALGGCERAAAYESSSSISVMGASVKR